MGEKQDMVVRVITFPEYADNRAIITRTITVVKFQVLNNKGEWRDAEALSLIRSDEKLQLQMETTIKGD